MTHQIEKPETVDDVIAAVRIMIKDHEPDGSPNIRMGQVKALLDEIERLRTEVKLTRIVVRKVVVKEAMHAIMQVGIGVSDAVDNAISAARNAVRELGDKASAAPAEPVAWMHDDPKRVDVIHDAVKRVLQNAEAAGTAVYRARPAPSKSEHYTIPLYAAPPAPIPPDSWELKTWPDGLRERLHAALKRIEDGYGIRRIPADPSDPDLVLGEVLALVEGRKAPFWIKPTAEVSPEDHRAIVNFFNLNPSAAVLAWKRYMDDAPSQSAAIRDVLAERRKQVEIGFTAAYDDTENANGDLSSAAACYALAYQFGDFEIVPAQWPFSRSMWKLKGQRRNLVRATALLIAEIERLDREAAKERS